MLILWLANNHRRPWILSRERAVTHSTTILRCNGPHVRCCIWLALLQSPSPCYYGRRSSGHHRVHHSPHLFEDWRAVLCHLPLCGRHLSRDGHHPFLACKQRVGSAETRRGLCPTNFDWQWVCSSILSARGIASSLFLVSVAWVLLSGHNYIGTHHIFTWVMDSPSGIWV